MAIAGLSSGTDVKGARHNDVSGPASPERPPAILQLASCVAHASADATMHATHMNPLRHTCRTAHVEMHVCSHDHFRAGITTTHLSSETSLGNTHASTRTTSHAATVSITAWIVRPAARIPEPKASCIQLQARSTSPVSRQAWLVPAGHNLDPPNDTLLGKLSTHFGQASKDPGLVLWEVGARPWIVGSTRAATEDLLVQPRIKCESRPPPTAAEGH